MSYRIRKWQTSLPAQCIECGSPITQSHKGRPRYFCADEVNANCRKRHNRRVLREEKKTQQHARTLQLKRIWKSYEQESVAQLQQLFVAGGLELAELATQVLEREVQYQIALHKAEVKILERKLKRMQANAVEDDTSPHHLREEYHSYHASVKLASLC